MGGALFALAFSTVAMFATREKRHPKLSLTLTNIVQQLINMAIQHPIFSDVDLLQHWETKYLRSTAAVQVWRDNLTAYVVQGTTPRPYDVATWDELKTVQREVALRLMQKAALVPDATNRLSGRAFVALVMQLKAALGNTQRACFHIVRDVLEEYNMRCPISTFGSYRVAKTRLFPQ